MDSQVAVRNLPARFPLVLLNCPGHAGEFDAITITNFEGALEMVRHLVTLGHLRIAIIKGAERNFDAAERLRGYRAALVEAGFVLSPELEVPGDFSEVSGFRAIDVLIRRPPLPTAVFAANDSMAIGALSALRRAGLRVPEDVAVAGFDDIPMARYMDPALSTVRVDIGALGEHATLRLLAAIREKETHQYGVEIFPTTLVLRRSCGAALPSFRPPGMTSEPALPSTLRL
jgi:LacI family transcriptional regulator